MIAKELEDPLYPCTEEEKAFLIAFDKAMNEIGYQDGGIQPYISFRMFMIPYSRTGLSIDWDVARLYLREEGLLLRFYLKDIDKHRAYIETAPAWIKNSFTDGYGRCRYCTEKMGEAKAIPCDAQIAYTIDDELIEKCFGYVFYFRNFSVDAIPAYMELLQTFYPRKPRKRANRKSKAEA